MGQTRYSEMTRKVYALLGAALLCKVEGNHKMADMWQGKADELVSMRDALPIMEAY